jgi:hypothetical protein
MTLRSVNLNRERQADAQPQLGVAAERGLNRQGTLHGAQSADEDRQADEQALQASTDERCAGNRATLVSW